MRIRRFLLPALLAFALAGVAQQPPANAQSKKKAPAASPSQTQSGPAKKKLVMKDGSDQVVSTWERKGDRVRYYSVERQEWEEVPASLVDWKATDDANRSTEAAIAEDTAAAAHIDRESKDDWLGPELVPGVRLPNNSDGLFLVDGGKLVTLPRQEANSHLDKGRLATSVLIPVPILKNRSLVQIPGARATVRLASAPAALFAAGRSRDDSRYALARLKTKGDARQVEAIEVGMLGRNPTHSGDYIELDSQAIAPDVFKLIPRSPIPPGEYAVVEFIGKDLNMYMWDFAVEK